MDNKFSVGDIAKLTGISVRTLQYYDTIGLLPIDKTLSNGKRVYNENDLFKLQQILFYKSMGIKLKEISKLINVDCNNAEIKKVLNKQREILYRQLNSIKSSIAFLEIGLESIDDNQELLFENIVQLLLNVNVNTIFEYENVDFEQYIEQTIKRHFDDESEIIEFYWEWKSLILEAVCKTLNDANPHNTESQKFAKKWVEMIEKITGKGPDLLLAHKLSYESREMWPAEDKRIMDYANPFIDKSVEYYLANVKEESND